MEDHEAKALAAQLGLSAKTGDELLDQCAERGLIVGVEHRTANWVVVKGGEVIARCK